MIQDDLKWNQYIAEGPENLTKKHKQKLSALKMIRKYMKEKTTKMVLNGIFMSHILYGACLWIGAQKYLKEKIQTLQLEACRLTLGKISTRWSKTKLLKEMNWMSIDKILERESMITTHIILNTMNPEHLYYKMTTKYKSKKKCKKYKNYK